MSPDEEARLIELDARWRATCNRQKEIIDRLLEDRTYDIEASGIKRIAELEAELEKLRAAQ